MKSFNFIVKAILALTIIMAIPCARGATAENLGYTFTADSKGNIEGMSETRFPESYRNGKGYVIENLDLSGMKNPVLRLWANEYRRPIANIPLQYVYIKTSESDEWKKLTVDQYLGCVNLPTETVSIGFSYDLSVSLSYITINETSLHSDDIVISDLNLTVEKGTLQEGDCIYADEDYTVEVTLSHPDLASLTTAHGDFGWRVQDNRSVSITITASTPSGTMLIMSGQRDYAGNHSVSFPLPAYTSEITFKFYFNGVRNPIMFDTIDGKLESDLCVGICEKGSDGNYMSFSNLPSGNDYAWYDIDGDGIMEWAGLDRYNRSVNRFNYDLRGESVIDRLSVDQWKNYGRDGISAVSSSGVYDWTGTEFQEALTLDHEIKVLDFNNDGKNDFLDSETNQLIYNTPIGEFSRSSGKFLTPQEYYDYVVEHKGSGLGSGMSVIGGGEGTPGSFGSFQYVDINNDGYFDYVDGPSGEYLMNVGDGRFVKDCFSGRVIFRDFNGDGINDMVSYDSSTSTLSLVIQNRDGDPKTTKLIGGFKCGDHIWCRDFDGDGDVDIVVPFDEEYNGGQSYIVTFENNGDASFKKREYFIDGFVDFRNCSDNDSDGNYEILGYAKNSASQYDYNRTPVQYRMDGLKLITDAITIGREKRVESDKSGILVADIDNSGRMRVILSDTIILTSERINMRPERPAAPKLSLDKETGDLIVSWDMGSDHETAAADLTYELRIGTSPDKCDILWSDALPSGMRRNFLQGNCGYSRQRRIATSSWPMGKIYVSVQTVDDNGMGSEFSEYAVFEKAEPAADFVAEAPSVCAVTDECILRMISNTENGINYEWNFDGGEILAGSDSKNVVVWQTPGTKKVTLKAVSSNGSTASITKDIEVVPAKLIEKSSESINDAVDLDLDGRYELLNHTQFLEYDDNGDYTPLKRLFNNNMTNGYKHRIEDINRDGLPDLVYSTHNGRGRYFIGQFVNEGDAYMERVDEVETDVYYSFGFDLDNDGLADAYGYRNTGDYINFVDVKDGQVGSDYYYYDYDGDGLMDKIYDAGQGMVKIFKNKGNFEYEEVSALDLGKRQNGLNLGDMDGDGMMDIAWNDAWEKYATSYSDFTYVRWGDGTVSSIPAPSGHQFYFISSVFDFDNNGCMDLLIQLEYDSNRGKRESVIVFFNPDRTWQMVNLGSDIAVSHYNDYVAYRRGDGVMGFYNMAITGPANTLPGVPSDVTATQNDDAIVIEWTAPNDNETPSAALRYNISIKHKDKEGESAYFWSPMNGGINGVPVPSSAQLLVAPRLTLPNGVIAPGEYEVKVQAVDTQMEAGEFSEVFILKVTESNILSGPAETMVGQATEFRMTSGYKAADFDFGEGAEIVNEVGTTLWVKWTSEGEKTIRKGEFSKVVLVHPALNAYFYLPSEVLVGAKIDIECDNLHNSEWQGLQLRDFESYMPLSSHFITFTEIDDFHAEMVFRYSVTPRGIEIRHTLTEPYGSDEYSVVVTTKVLNEKPSIFRVDRNLSSGACQLYWSMPEELSGLANGVRIYKESENIGKFELLAELPLGTATFTDSSEDSYSESSRYRLSFRLPYGETEMAQAHKAVALMIDDSGSDMPLLSWTEYEGRIVNSYRVLRGTSVADLICIKELTPSTTYYRDMTPLEGDAVYVVEAVLMADGDDLSVRSNPVSTQYSGVDEVYADKRGKLDVVVSESGIAVNGIIVPDEGRSDLKLFNSSGMLISSVETSLSEALLPCGKLPAGVYFVVAEGQVRQMRKLILH